MDYGYVWYDSDRVMCLDDIQPSSMIKDIVESIAECNSENWFSIPRNENNLYEIANTVA